MEEKEIVSYCMGCGKIRHKKEGAKWVRDDRDIYDYSHGYCPRCWKKVFKQYREELESMGK
jgi:hypothetical protein